MLKLKLIGTLILCTTTLAQPVVADSFCANEEQSKLIHTFFAENPGSMPAIAARRLGLPEAIVASGLPAGQAASASSSIFPDVWASMTEWNVALFLIMKGANVFEIKSAAGEGKPSEASNYFNVAYEHPLRGHLRPDLYTSIYAIEMPGRTDQEPNRGVIFFDENGDSVFGAFLSSDGPDPAPSEVAKFHATMELIKASPSVCSGQD